MSNSVIYSPKLDVSGLRPPTSRLMLPEIRSSRIPTDVSGLRPPTSRLIVRPPIMDVER